MVNMSHQTAGFAPYRLDNCSPEVLHVRQAQHTFLQAERLSSSREHFTRNPKSRSTADSLSGASKSEG